ncbi:MAG: hypothetical protein UEJ46_01525 [Eggerthellaceae bacterium]|nr:hypothetical protein [Eggerthellaceae bacterium]
MDWAVGGQRIGKLPSLPKSFAHSLQMWSITAITLLRQPTRFENKNLALSATIFAIADPRPPSKVGNGPSSNLFDALLRRCRHSKVPQQSAIAKKLQKSRKFCFCTSETALLSSASWSNVAADSQGQR